MQSFNPFSANLYKGVSQLLQCPVCFQLMEALTSRHCMTEHGLEKTAVITHYGKPPVIMRPFTNFSRSQPVVDERDYTNYQLFERRFRSSNREFHVDRATT